MSESSLDCFGTRITDVRKDMFCIAKGVSMLHTRESTEFKLNCTTWTSTGPDNRTAPLDPKSFPKYMYDTGPYHVYNQYFSAVTGSASEPFCTQSPDAPKYTILLKREGDGNLWHSLLEIFSLYLTIDTLRISPLDPSTPSTSAPFLSAADAASTQIVILDDHPDGPYFDLWHLFAPLPIVRLKHLPTTSPAPSCLQNVIIPLAGGSNPLWRGDWHPAACTHSALVAAFSRRVLSQHGLLATPTDDLPAHPPPLTLTLVDRRSTRRLAHSPALLAALRARFPPSVLRIQALDFAAVTFAEQLRVVRGTDVLVAVHGAALAHALFLPDGASVVEILPPGVEYWVYRNLAGVRGGLRYFCGHADGRTGEGKGEGGGDWHGVDVEMREGRFVELVEAGVRAVLHRGGRVGDVV